MYIISELNNQALTRTTMKTYNEYVNGIKYRYFWNWHIKSWTVEEIDDQGNQISCAEFFANKKSLLANYPFTFKFLEPN